MFPSVPCLTPRPLILCVLLAALSAASAQVVISEFMASNVNTTIVDEDGDHEDWLELKNTGATTVSLNGWYLTDNSGDLRKWQFPVSAPSLSLAPDARLLVWASNKNRKAAANRLHTNFRLDPDGEYLALVRPDGLTVEHGYAPQYPKQATDISYGLPEGAATVLYVQAGTAGKAKTATSAADFTANFTGWNSSPAFNDGAWQAGANGFGYEVQTGYGSYIGAGGDVLGMMYNINESLFIRFVFNVADASQVTGLTLRMKYDDGFLGYLNGGAKVAGLNDPVTPAWNSGATANRPDGLNDSWETYNLNAYLPQLVTGSNLLAFQGLNNGAGSSDFLVLCELEATIAPSGGVQPPSYLSSATPGSANAGAKTNLGPFISQVTKQPARPVPGTTQNIAITAKVLPSLRPLALANPVQLAYRTMYGAETLVPMLDNGLAPDVLAGDTIFTANLPVATLGAGQMVRWRVIAADITAVAGTDPPYLDPLDNDRYYGTVAVESSIQSNLPVLYWFTDNAAATQTGGGARCAFFLQPIDDPTVDPGHLPPAAEFYDNVQADLHGQSSSGFPVAKKSHDLNFNQDNRLFWKYGEPKVKGINLLTNYADKAKVRNTLAWESFGSAGGYTHFCVPMRVQQVRPDNAGAPAQHFWGVYDFVENGDDKWLDRLGLDPNGALYKIYDTLADPNTAEKKTREYEDRSDLAAFENGLVETLPQTERRRYGYDNVDLPAAINCLAALAIVNDVDQGHKNFYVYRDTSGTGEWTLLPWDVDLSFGHNWTFGGAPPNTALGYHYFDDNTYANSGLHLGADNRLKTLIWNSNELNAMFVRRVRSLMDKLLQPASTPLANRYFESRIAQLMDQIDPPAIGTSDADLDFSKWGGWTFPTVSGGAPTIDNNAATRAMRPEADRIKNTFLANQRTAFFSASPPISPGTAGNLAVPTSQPAVPANVLIQSIDFNPAGGNQDQEYFVIRNANTYALDISGWKVTGAVDFTFRAGTVIPALGTATSDGTSTTNVNLLVVAKNPAQWRLRTASPKAQELRYITGSFGNHLSARGETIKLVIPGATPAQDVIVATSTYAGAPTAGQSFLRISELNYKPATPTAAELLALPGVTASDFEFIELVNTSASALALGNASFTKGVEFKFPAVFSLGAGARVLIVANQAAFTQRYGSGLNIAGAFLGNLDNAGETIQLLDAVGEEVLEFTYDPEWYGVPDASEPDGIGEPQGYSLVTRTTAPAYDSYGTATTWALGSVAGGTPGGADTVFSHTFIGWRQDFFTPTEQLNAALSAPAADADGDGRSNFREFAFGGNPRIVDQEPGTVASRVNVAGTDYAAITFARQRNAIDTIYTAQVSSDLAAWTPITTLVGTPIDLGNGMERVTYRDAQPFPNTKRFLRVSAVR